MPRVETMSFLDGLWNSEETPESRKRRRHRLRDIEVSEVSLVDRAANKRKFLVTKREGEMLKTIDLKGSTDFGTDPNHLKSEVRKGEAIPTPVKNVVQRALTEATERLMGVVQAVRRAEESTERAPRPLPQSIGKEIMAVGSLLQGVLRSYPSPVESDEDKKKDEDEEKEDTEKSMSTSARKAILDTLDGINKRIIALHSALKAEEDEGDDDEDEAEKEDKAADSEDDKDEEKDADDADKADDDEDEKEEDEEKTDTKKSAIIAREIQGIALALGGALARVPTAKAIALVEIDVPADTIEKDADGLVLHPLVKKALSSGLEDALDALSTSLRNLNRIDAAKSDDVPAGYTLPSAVVDGAAKASNALLTMGMNHGTIASGEAHDLDASLRAAQKAPEDAKADTDEEEKEDDADKAVADKAKKGKAKAEPDMAETIKDAVAAAMAPLNERLDTIESGVKKNAKSVKKAMGAKSAGNAIPAGTKVEKSDEMHDEGLDLHRLSPDKVKKLKDDGLWF